MQNSFLKWVGGLTIVLSQGASAAPITDTVIAGGQEWAQVNLFTNVSWDAIDAQCPSGVCSKIAAINGYSLDGWRWASIEEVQTLFNAFTGQEALAGDDFYYEFDSAWGPLFLGLFNPTDDSSIKSVQGWSSTEQGDKAYVGGIGTGISIGTINIPDGAGTSETFDKDVQRRSFGGWFLRDTNQIPAPATLSMFGLGLVSLAIFRRKYATKV